MAEKPKLQLLVRVANTDIDGKKKLQYALTKVKGVSKNLANALCHVASVDHQKLTGHLTEKEIESLTSAIKDPVKAGIPTWMLNRRKDPETGVDNHLVLGDVEYVVDNDKKRLAKVKSYRGLRHQWKLPVRGQRTSSNHRRSKAKAASAAKKGRRKA